MDNIIPDAILIPHVADIATRGADDVVVCLRRPGSTTITVVPRARLVKAMGEASANLAVQAAAVPQATSARLVTVVTIDSDGTTVTQVEWVPGTLVN